MDKLVINHVFNCSDLWYKIFKNTSLTCIINILDETNISHFLQNLNNIVRDVQLVCQENTIIKPKLCLYDFNSYNNIQFQDFCICDINDFKISLFKKIRETLINLVNVNNVYDVYDVSLYHHRVLFFLLQNYCLNLISLNV